MQSMPRVRTTEEKNQRPNSSEYASFIAAFIVAIFERLECF